MLGFIFVDFRPKWATCFLPGSSAAAMSAGKLPCAGSSLQRLARPRCNETATRRSLQGAYIPVCDSGNDFAHWAA